MVGELAIGVVGQGELVEAHIAHHQPAALSVPVGSGSLSGGSAAFPFRRIRTELAVAPTTLEPAFRHRFVHRPVLDLYAADAASGGVAVVAE